MLIGYTSTCENSVMSFLLVRQLFFTGEINYFLKHFTNLFLKVYTKWIFSPCSIGIYICTNIKVELKTSFEENFSYLIIKYVLNEISRFELL